VEEKEHIVINVAGKPKFYFIEKGLILTQNCRVYVLWSLSMVYDRLGMPTSDYNLEAPRNYLVH